MRDTNERDVLSLIEDMSKGNNTEDKLMYDIKTGKLIKVPKAQTTKETLIELSPEEANMFMSDTPMLILTKEDICTLLQKCSREGTSIKLCHIDDGDVIRINENGKVNAKFFDLTNSIHSEKRILAGMEGQEHILIFFRGNDKPIHSYWIKDGKYQVLGVITPPAKEELFSRVNGIYETAALSEKKVGIIGLGSGGSPIALELSKQGVQKFLLIDPDRLETGNISRHICGVTDLGRYKTKAVASRIKNKNPYAEITTVEADITKMTEEEKEYLFSDLDLVLCCTDSRESKLIINRFCIEHNLVCIYGGAFRRAYGGQVLRVIPHKTMCYQCFVSSLPNVVNDTEISNQRQVDRIAYSDRPDVPIEPGLSTDIAPISTFVVKLAILELIKGSNHTMQNLYDDLEASLYIWFNRREKGTLWEKALNPLGVMTNKMSILRWYGVSVEANENCPVCGNRYEVPQFKSAKLFGE